MGKPLSAETRAKMSAARMGNRNALGYKHTKEARAKISASLSGNVRTLGYKHTLAARAKISEAGRGRVCSPETRIKIAAPQSALVGTTATDGKYVKVKTFAGWERQHRVMAGLSPGDGLVAHHKDRDGANNSKANLEVFESQAAHSRHHAAVRRIRG